MEKLGGGVKWLFRRIETHTRQRNPAGVKCELLRARLWTMMMNRSQGDHGVMLSGHSLMGAWCLQGRREMVGLSQEEGGRCQGVEWKLSQTGVMEKERGKVDPGQGPGQHPTPRANSRPRRGSRQAYHSHSGGATQPERAPRGRRHLHLHGQEQGGRGREWALVRVCLLGSLSPTPISLASPTCSLRLIPWCGPACIMGNCQAEPWISTVS